jgi:hypothetical protein
MLLSTSRSLANAAILRAAFADIRDKTLRNTGADDGDYRCLQPIGQRITFVVRVFAAGIQVNATAWRGLTRFRAAAI